MSTGNLFISIVGMLYIVICTISTFIIIKKVNRKGYNFFDAYFIGVWIYVVGVFIAHLIEDNDNSLKLLSITLLLLTSTFIIWAFNKIFFKVGIDKSHFINRYSENHSFAIGTALLLILINIGFIYLVYIRIVQGHFAGVIALLDIRKTIASGEAGYFAPGIIKQLRDIYGPAFIAWVIIFYRSKYRKLIIWSVVLTTICSMLIGGQRTPILVLMLIIFLSLNISSAEKTKNYSMFKILTAGIFCVLFLLFLNILLGRSDGDENNFMLIINLIGGLLGRVFTTVPIENVHAMEFISKAKFEYFSLWLSDLSILLPGTQVGFTNELHSYLGGSNQGNAVLGYSLDIYVNSGVAGIFFVPVLTVLFLNILQFCIHINKNPFSLSIFMVCFFYLPFCYSFYHFLLNGGVFIITFLIYDILIIRKKNKYGLENQKANSFSHT